MNYFGITVEKYHFIFTMLLIIVVSLGITLIVKEIYKYIVDKSIYKFIGINLAVKIGFLNVQSDLGK
ncbi:hypothetical protein UT300005_15230 [Clostridium sp. CTA-5]